ncbi:MAG: TonB-dependent receptor [Tannerella sp.]|nr:TonB-dependent receptor [Tannerella sp.]
MNQKILLKKHTSAGKFILALICLICSLGLYAQNERITISGTVTDNTGEALIGVNIIEKGTTNGTSTNVDGQYMLSNVASGGTLEFSYIGFKTQEIKVNGRTNIQITMSEDGALLDEVVVVGYGVQKKVTLTGAVAAVTNDQIITTKNENIQNMLTGKLPGVRVVQKSSEPGSFGNSFDIRGMGNPLIIVDGVPRDNFDRFDANDIESISVLKDASAAIYGVRAANGVVLITTKKGSSGSINIEYSGNVGWQNPSGAPKSVNAADWMVLKNERSMHNVNGGFRPYSDEDIAEYRNGTKTSTNWWDEIMRSAAPQTQHSVSATGGNDNINFYVSGGYLYQESFMRSNDLNYERFNVRSNISAKISKRLTIDLNISGIMDEKNQPWTNADWMIRGMQRAPAIQPVYANDNPLYYQFGYIEGVNPKAQTDADLTGYKKHNNKWFQSSASFTYDVPYIDGLKLKGTYSYDYQVRDNEEYEKKYPLYEYDAASNKYETKDQGSINKLKRAFYTNNSTLYNLALDYRKLFAEVHNVNAFFAVEGSWKKGDNFFAFRELSLDLPYLFAGNTEKQEGSMSTTYNDDEKDMYEQANLAWIGRLGYDYKSKYMIEGSFRYDGSSLFPSNSRWGFFPSVSGGWRISEEAFWQNSPLSFINNLKLRASYGKLGDDSAARYQYLAGFSYPAQSGGDALDIGTNRLPSGYIFDGTYVNAVSNKGIPNADITWYVSKTLDVGLDLEAWNGLFGLGFDYFERRRSGLLATRVLSLPVVVGAVLPQENLESDLTHGIELELSHRNQISDFRYNVKGILTITRIKKLHDERARAGNSWENWINNNEDRYMNRLRGHAADGRWSSYADIANSSIYVGRGTLPGDYRYLDWNGDGRIDDDDKYYYAFEDSKTPFMNFSINMGAEWRNFDFNMLWQGSALGNVRYIEQLREPMWGHDQSNALKYFMDRWHPTDPNADPYNHTTQWISGKYAYTGTMPDEWSEHNVYKSDYVRLKSLELGYTLSGNVINKIGIKGARIYVNGYNLLTFKYVELDPEHNSDNYGNTYPLNRTFSIGANIKF